jgi:hypothetical protein
MPTSKYSPIDTKPLPSNIMDLRDEAFYEFVRQFSGKCVAELLAFQECNGVESLLGCKYVTAILRFQSDQLNDIKKHTCITLRDGTIALLPGLESSINNLIKLLKKKREEVNKQAQQIQSITSALSNSNAISSVLPTNLSISHAPIHTTSLSNAPLPDNPDNLSSINSLATPDPLVDEISNRISTTISEWLQKKQQELELIDFNFQQGIDFHVELNRRHDGVIMRCKCGVKYALGQTSSSSTLTVEAVENAVLQAYSHAIRVVCDVNMY